MVEAVEADRMQLQENLAVTVVSVQNLMLPMVQAAEVEEELPQLVTQQVQQAAMEERMAAEVEEVQAVGPRMLVVLPVLVAKVLSSLRIRH